MPRDLPVGCMIPGVGGSLNLHHPVACQALLDAAAEAGAIVHRGVREIVVTPGERPTVAYRLGERSHTMTTSLVVGADGRGSVVRRGAGIQLQQQEASAYVVGLLLDDVAGLDQHDVVMEHDLGVCLLLRQGAGRARAYHMVPVEHRTRYAGDGGSGRFLADASAPGSPLAAALADARPVGPCGAVPGTDTWTDRPYGEGVVLIGDAAGHNDPGVGCGLSIAMRDARIVRDLVLAGAQRASDFEPYGVERFERMRRLRLIGDLIASATVETSNNRSARRRRFAGAMATRDASVFQLVHGMFAGPETIPSGLVNEGVLDLVRAA